MKNITELFKVFSDETRLRIINLLFEQELCVCELVQVLDLSQPKISKHIAKIRQIDLVATKRNEQYIYYSLNKNDMNYYSILEETVKECRKNDLFKNDIIELNKIESFVCRGN